MSPPGDYVLCKPGRGQPERVIEFAEYQRPRIARDVGAAKLQCQAATAIESNNVRLRIHPPGAP